MSSSDAALLTTLATVALAIYFLPTLAACIAILLHRLRLRWLPVVFMVNFFCLWPPAWGALLGSVIGGSL